MESHSIDGWCPEPTATGRESLFKPQTWSRFALLGALAVFVTACQLVARDKPAAAGQPAVVPSGVTNQQGYRLLFDLVGDERNVSKLLLIKHERPELGTLIKEISATSARAHKQLEAFAKADPTLDFRSEILPPTERQTRDRIGKDRAKELLKAKGKNLELSLLLTQNEALVYGSHLAAVLAGSESVPARREFLQRVAADLGRLQAKVMEMLLAHYS